MNGFSDTEYYNMKVTIKTTTFIICDIIAKFQVDRSKTYSVFYPSEATMHIFYIF